MNIWNNETMKTKIFIQTLVWGEGGRFHSQIKPIIWIFVITAGGSYHKAPSYLNLMIRKDFLSLIICKDHIVLFFLDLNLWFGWIVLKELYRIKAGMYFVFLLKSDFFSTSTILITFSDSKQSQKVCICLFLVVGASRDISL